MKHITDVEYQNLGMKTDRQWSKEGKLPNNGAGIRLWTNPHHNRTCMYYRPDEVHIATKEELDTFLEPIRAKRRIYEQKREKRLQEEFQQLLDARYECGVSEMEIKYEGIIKHMRKGIKDNLYPLLMKSTVTHSGTYVNHTNKIVFDIETTGLDETTDEILQISILDGAGNVLLNSYVKPYYMESWVDAEKVNGITMEMVKNAPYAHELSYQLQQIFANADEWIAYNGSFDLSFLKYLGIDLRDGVSFIDVMADFAPYYGEWDYYSENYKWQSLVKCAGFFEYDFSPHDSLEDARATLHCFNAIQRLRASGEYEQRISLNNASRER